MIPPLTVSGKPAPWAFARRSLERRARALWPGCTLAWPLWSRGQAEDVSGSSLHGVLSGLDADSFEGTSRGLGVRFNGDTAEKIAVGDPSASLLDDADRLSADILVRFATLPVDQVGLFSKYRAQDLMRAWHFFLENDQEVSLQISSDTTDFHKVTTAGAVLAVDTWHHIAFTYDRGATVIYVDARPFPLTLNFANIAGGDQELKIGQRTNSNGTPGDPLDGWVAVARIWHGRALTESEVRQLAADPFGMFRPVVGWSESALEHAGSSGAGPWSLAGSVSAGTQSLLITGLQNGISYDVQAKTEDASMNESSGSAIVSATPAAEAGSPRSSGLRFRRVVSPEAAGRFPGHRP